MGGHKKINDYVFSFTGLPSMRRSPSISTDKSSSQQDSKESLNSVDLGPQGQQGKGQGHLASPGQQIGSVITVGLGGVCDQVRIFIV